MTLRSATELGNRRARVVTLIDSLSLTGGAERLAFEIATRLDQNAFESTMCVSQWPPTDEDEQTTGELVERLRVAGVRLLKLRRAHRSHVWAWGQLVHFLRRERIDVLHAHKFGSNVWGVLTGRAARVPVVIAHEHSWSYEGDFVRRFLDREVIARGADRLIAVSRMDQRRMIDVEGIAPDRTLFIPNGIASAKPDDGRDVRAELGIGPAVPLIGSVGSLYPVKAFDVLLHATALLRRDHPDIHVLIAGDGPERERLEALSRELGLVGSVSLAGRREDVPSVLRALDLAVCCSKSEGSPLSVMEYMQAGLAVVASNVGGVPDLIEPEVNGLLVAPGDPAALAAAVAGLLDDRRRAQAMGDRGRERQRAEFDVDVLVHRVEALYLELLLLGARSG